MQATSVIKRRYNTRDIEELLNKHRTTIWRWVKAGAFPEPQYINGQRSWSEDDLDEWLEGLETFDEHHAR